MFLVKRWLEVFGKNVAVVFLSAHSPDHHFPIYVILTDYVMADIDGSRVFIHIWLDCDVLGGLVVCAQKALPIDT
jgi:hypothetical protein